MPRSHTQPSPPAAGGELECPRCGTVAVNSDFCACGEYLAWELKLAAPEEDAPAPAPPAYRPPEPAPPRASTLLALRDPAREDPPGTAVSISVVPGAEVTVLAAIRNQGEIVDTFEVRVDGLPDGWWTISPATVYLNPWGTAGDYQLELQVRLHPPRASQAEARAWPLQVVARSRSRAADVASVDATLTIEPFQNTVMTVGPERRRGRRHVRFDVAVANHGNGPAEIAVGARDTEDRCPISIGPALVTVPVGAIATAVVLVDAPRPLIVGRPVDHHVDVAHRVTGLQSHPTPQRVTFQQRPWLPWWVPPALLLLAAFVTVVLMLYRHPEAPNLTGRTVPNATKLLKRHDLAIGRTTYEAAPKGVLPYSIIAQVPEPGAEVVRDRVDITLAAPPKSGPVPSVRGRTLVEATDALAAAHFASSPQPSSAGDDWVVIRQDPSPGTRRDLGTPVTLAVAQPTPSPTPAATPTATATPAATPGPSATPAASAAAKPKSAGTSTATAKESKAKAIPLPADLVFAGATTGQLYRWSSGGAKPARLTSPMYRLQTPAATDEGFVAVQLTSSGRRLVQVSRDGKTVNPLASGAYFHPAFSSKRGLLAVISGAQAGTLCVLDPQVAATPACAAAGGQRVGQPAWSPDGRSVLALGAGRDGAYHELLRYPAGGGDPAQWKAPASIYRSPSIRSAVWVGDDRIALLLAASKSAPAHLRLLARRPNGSFRRVKDFPALTGSELAAKGHYLVLRRGSGDGTMDLLDVDRAVPRLRSLGSGANPVWAS